MNEPIQQKRRVIVISLLLFTLAILLLGMIVWAVPAQQTGIADSGTEASCGGEPPSGCTVFTVAKGKKVFFGGNDDWITPDSYYWVDPGGAQGYGAIWVGTRDNVQQGINEKGLAYDANGLPRVDVNPHPERLPVPGGYTSYPINILRECATVAEVIAWVNTHQWHSYMHDQMQFADASGDAVIISAGADGEVAFARKPKGDGYLVSSNFNVANPANSFSYPCWRYATAQERLGGLINQEGELTAQDAARVLDAVHQDGGTSWTIESLVADLPNGIVYLYYYYQFDKPVVLDVAKEIATARAGRPLSALFPEDVRQEATRRYEHIQRQGGFCGLIGKIWVGLDLASVVLLVFSLKNRERWIFWIPVVAILGPLGLLIWLLTRRRRPAGTWQVVLVEAAGDVAPAVVTFVIMVIVVISVPGAQASAPLQILLIFGLPPLVGWLVFQGLLLALGTKAGYLRLLRQRLPQAWVAANLGMGGINALAAPMIFQSTRNCSILPLSPWMVMTWWSFIILGTLGGGLLLFGYESWDVRRGFRAWSVLALGEDEVVSPPWRRQWWWILLSYVVLFGGVVGSALLQQLLSTLTR